MAAVSSGVTSMSDRVGISSWSLSLGTLFSTQIRVSPLFLIVALILSFRLGWQVGLAYSGFLFLALLLHELGHVLVARATGGAADEILIWPLGGLAFVQYGPRLSSAVQTLLAGPFTNLAVAGLVFPAFYAPEMTWDALNPLVVPVREFHSASWGRECLLLVFSANWILFLINLLPIFPLDGGQMISAILNHRMSSEAAFRITASAGAVAAALLLGIGLSFDLSWVVAIGAITLIMNLLLSMQFQTGESYDDSFMGYDFSQGYTSLERSGQSANRPPNPSWMEVWKSRRKERLKARQAARRKDLEQQLDDLLAKVHEQGLNALTSTEKRLLKRASEELKHRSRPQDS